MFGKNVVFKQSNFKDRTTLDIKSIFHTIQGEGPYSGYPATFIRFGFCSLQCTYCDTDFESQVQEFSIDEILTQVEEITPDTTSLCVITGGEPMLQPKITELVNALLERSFNVQLETSGSLYIDDLPYDNEDLMIICSPKTGKLNTQLEPHIFAYKYVISYDNYNEEDGLPNFIPQGTNNKTLVARPNNDAAEIYLSPMDVYNPIENAKNIETVTQLCLKHGYILSLQIHKIINVE
jgi:7-carboxy-7-deazaguanine synthase